MPGEADNEFRLPRKKRRAPGCLGTFLILTPLLLVAAAGGLSYFAPHLVPASLAGYLPWIEPTVTNTPTPLPTPTVAASATPIPPLTTATPSRSPTLTLQPTQGATLTPTLTLTPSPTQLGGGAGQVAFVSDRTGVPQIYLANLDGSGTLPITNLPEGACQPSWSPDGASLVFTSPCETDTDTYRGSGLYLINADGSGLTALMPESYGDYDPAWSPEGDRIAFTSLRDGLKEIYVLTLDSMQVTRLTTSSLDEENNQPAWSPFGNQIVFVKKRVGALQIWAMTDSGQNPFQVVRSGQELWDFEPVWSPDGASIFFSQRQVDVPSLSWLMQIHYEDRGSQTATRLKLGVVGVENLAFSPDGLWMVYEGVDDRGNKDIYYMAATGEARTQLSTDPGDDFDPVWRPVPGP